MICPNCGTDNKRNFCIKCGALVTENNIYQITTETRNKTTDDLELFIGDNSNAILYKPVNWAAAFTGGFYFVYCKCYFIGILSFIISFAISQLILYMQSTIMMFLLIGLTFIFFASLTNPIYLWWAKRKIKKIDCTNKKALIEQGGTSIVAVAICWLIIFLLFELWLLL